MSAEPNPEHMTHFCREILPAMLVEACEVAVGDAGLVAEDVLLRAEAAAHLDNDTRQILAAPFYEDSFDHEPDEAPVWMKAITTLVVRNSQLEELHANGPVNAGGITVITKYGLGPLSHLIAARRLRPLPAGPPSDLFHDLADAYPRAWTCLGALRTALNTGGGRVGYRMPEAPVPRLPDDSEVTDAPPATHLETYSDGFTGIIFSGVDPRFDRQAFDWFKAAQEDELLLGLSSLSRISRNSSKLLRVLEFFLAHQARILTTNCLLTHKEVWVRRNRLIKPDSEHPFVGLRDLNGVSGSHRKAAVSFVDQITSVKDS
jgi:hypothetical protein